MQPKSAQLGYVNPEFNTTEKASPSDFYWLAGLYEGEGSCQATKSSTTASMPQKDRWVLDRVRSLFGGTVYPHSWGTELGYSGYRWGVSGARARGVLQSIYEFLSPRRQAQIRKAMGWT